ncbi:hypothetical protein TWF481_004498 [Arthrobotrys musiformis]|uniref:Uncharacterized protein n=1 Tax=Arthrobotrys musiformis TaxID=47236 RepID=A0AAV9WJV1_9PEZI
MLLKAFVIGSGLISLASAGCAADNCLRAIRATARLSDASTQCSSFFAIPTVTYTETLSFSETSFSTTFITKTTTIEVTASTSTDTTTTTTLQIAPTTTLTVNAALRKRGEAVPSIPAYASPCSGAVRFSSACLCIGVASPTVTPSTTITLSTTLSFSTVQTSIETSTIYTTVTTKTQTNVNVITSTVGGVATQTIKPFQIEVTFPGNSIKYLKPFIRFPGSNAVIYTGFADTRAETPWWYLDGTTIRSVQGDTVTCQDGTTWGWVYARTYGPPCVCSIDAARKISCTGSGNSIFVAWDQRMSIAATEGSVWGSYQFVTLKAIV